MLRLVSNNTVVEEQQQEFSSVKAAFMKDKIKFRYDSDWFGYDITELINEAIKLHRSQIEQWLIDRYDADVLSGEGYTSLDEWFGMGSYAMMELGLEFTFKFTGNYIYMTVDS